MTCARHLSPPADRNHTIWCTVFSDVEPGVDLQVNRRSTTGIVDWCPRLEPSDRKYPHGFGWQTGISSNWLLGEHPHHGVTNLVP